MAGLLKPAFVLTLNVDLRWFIMVFFTDMKNTINFYPLKTIFLSLFDKFVTFWNVEPLIFFLILNTQPFIPMSDSIIDRYNQLLNRIEDACKNTGRDPKEIMLVAVSKTKPTEDILTLAAHGHLHFGENRAKELEDKMHEIENPALVWHFIGNLQTNKIKYMADRVNWIQSVHKKKALKEVEKRASRINRVINVLIQVNISAEDQKSGCDPEKLESILTYAQNLKYTRVRGLMGMATFTDDAEVVRPEFSMLRKLKESHEHLNKGAVKLEHLSMGMTNDLEVAIREGSTMVRVGTAIFGERNY